MKSIVQLRGEIDVIDQRILGLLDERLELVRKLAKEKQKAGLPLSDEEREEQLKEMWKERAIEMGLDINSISKIFDEVLHMSKKAQMR